LSWKNISEKTIREQQPNKWLRCEERPLALVPREPNLGTRLGAAAIALLEKLVSRYRPGQIFSFQEIADGRPMATKSAISKLWRAGYLDKYALGEWGGGWRGKHAGRAGKYWGVHYMLTEKINEISRRSS
jgi:hypothetical protein